MREIVSPFRFGGKLILFLSIFIARTSVICHTDMALLLFGVNVFTAAQISLCTIDPDKHEEYMKRKAQPIRNGFLSLYLYTTYKCTYVEYKRSSKPKISSSLHPSLSFLILHSK